MYFIIKIYRAVQKCLDKISGKYMFKQVYDICIIIYGYKLYFHKFKLHFGNAVLQYRYF